MKRDIAAVLRGIALANEAAGAVGADPNYVAGQRATLLVVATALDIPAHELQLDGEGRR